MPIRQLVSEETLDRAIRARVAIDYGVESPCLARRVRLRRKPDVRGLPNWSVDTGDVPDDMQGPILAAAGEVALKLNLM